jgi:hypothetical protein
MNAMYIVVLYYSWNNDKKILYMFIEDEYFQAFVLVLWSTWFIWLQLHPQTFLMILPEVEGVLQAGVLLCR